MTEMTTLTRTLTLALSQNSKVEHEIPSTDPLPEILRSELPLLREADKKGDLEASYKLGLVYLYALAGETRNDNIAMGYFLSAENDDDLKNDCAYYLGVLKVKLGFKVNNRKMVMDGLDDLDQAADEAFMDCATYMRGALHLEAPEQLEDLFSRSSLQSFIELGQRYGAPYPDATFQYALALIDAAASKGHHQARLLKELYTAWLAQDAEPTTKPG